MKRPMAAIPYLADTFYYSARDADAYMDHLEALLCRAVETIENLIVIAPAHETAVDSADLVRRDIRATLRQCTGNSAERGGQDED